MPTYKLYYFKGTGRAETARMIFALKGVEFEDIRYSSEEWAEKKAEFPMKQLPCLEVDGKRYGQSAAINSYLARVLGAYGKDETHMLKIDQIVGCVEDLAKPMIAMYYEKDEEEKKKKQQNFVVTQFPDWLTNMKEIIQEYAEIAPNEVTLAEISVYNILDYIKKEEAMRAILDKHPVIVAFANKVENNPKLKAYIASRPQS